MDSLAGRQVAGLPRFQLRIAGILGAAFPNEVFNPDLRLGPLDDGEDFVPVVRARGRDLRIIRAQLEVEELLRPPSIEGAEQRFVQLGERGWGPLGFGCIVRRRRGSGWLVGTGWVGMLCVGPDGVDQAGSGRPGARRGSARLAGGGWSRSGCPGCAFSSRGGAGRRAASPGSARANRTIRAASWGDT